MALHPTQTRHERILAMGPPNGGKSKIWRDVADWIHETKADAKLFVQDTDHAWEAQRPNDNHLDEIVHVDEAYDYGALKTGMTHAVKEARPQDWLVLDMADRMYSYAKQDYFERAYGKDFDDYFIEQKAKDQGIGGDWGSNWQGINALYEALVDRMKKFRGHVLACVPCVDLRYPDEKTGRGGDSPAMIALFDKVRVKPAGHKELAYEFHTVALMSQSLKGGWVFSTPKERQSPEQPREKVFGAKVEPDFVTSYLMKIGGWRP